MNSSKKHTSNNNMPKIELPEFLIEKQHNKIELPLFLLENGTDGCGSLDDHYAVCGTCESSAQACKECTSCQGCEDSCQRMCESECMDYCEVNGECDNCLRVCQTTCQSACQSLCESSHQCSCQSCESCEYSCEYNCQGAQHIHNWEYTDWQYVDENRCKRLKYCSGSGTCTSKPEEEYRSHDYWVARYEWVNNETCKSIFKCSYCGNEKGGTTTSHVWEIEGWDQGDETHCKKNLICSACKGTLTQLVKHEFVDGKCKWCGREENGFPPKFEWSRPKVKGESFYFGVDEYERYVNYLNQKLVYFKKSKVSKTKVTKGEKVTALTINDLLAGLRRLNAKSVPSDVSKGGIITASFLNNLRDSLNSVVKPVAQEEIINE